MTRHRWKHSTMRAAGSIMPLRIQVRVTSNRVRCSLRGPCTRAPAAQRRTIRASYPWTPSRGSGPDTSSNWGTLVLVSMLIDLCHLAPASICGGHRQPGRASPRASAWMSWCSLRVLRRLSAYSSLGGQWMQNCLRQFHFVFRFELALPAGGALGHAVEDSVASWDARRHQLTFYPCRPQPCSLTQLGANEVSGHSTRSIPTPGPAPARYFSTPQPTLLQWRRFVSMTWPGASVLSRLHVHLDGMHPYRRRQ